MSVKERKIRKAAILVASLDREAADIVMSQMTPLQARLVRRAMVELGSPDPVEQNDVIEDFFRTAPRVRRDDLDGIELGDEMLPNVTHHVPEPHAQEIASSNNRPLHFLKDAAVDPLVPLLERERPQTIAVVLSHLAPANSAQLLGRLPAAQQVEVTHCLMGLDQIDATALRALEEGVAQWLRQHSLVQEYRDDTPADGRAAVEQILSMASRETRENMRSALPEKPDSIAMPSFEPAVHTNVEIPSELQPLVTQPIPQRAFDFEQFCELAPLDASRILAQAYPEVAALALIGADTTFSEQVLEHLSISNAAEIRSNMHNLGPTSLADVELAQREIASLAEQHHHRFEADPLPNRRLSVVG